MVTVALVGSSDAGGWNVFSEDPRASCRIWRGEPVMRKCSSQNFVIVLSFVNIKDEKSAWTNDEYHGVSEIRIF